MQLITADSAAWVLSPTASPSQSYHAGGVVGTGTSMVAGNYRLIQDSLFAGPGSVWEADPRYAWAI
jgi:hypothetical protein